MTMICLPLLLRALRLRRAFPDAPARGHGRGLDPASGPVHVPARDPDLLRRRWSSAFACEAGCLRTMKCLALLRHVLPVVRAGLGLCPDRGPALVPARVLDPRAPYSLLLVKGCREDLNFLLLRRETFR